LKQRAFAPYIYKALLAAQQSIACGERDAAAIKCRAAAVLQHAPEIKLEYFELMDPNTIRPVDVVRAPCYGNFLLLYAKTPYFLTTICSGESNGSAAFVFKRIS
jgi:pantothenate synthetase